MFQTINYLKFLLKSTNQHGVHSPFIYNYVTKCLYAEKMISNIKAHNVLLKTIGYFGFENICVSGARHLAVDIKKSYPNSKLNTNRIDILYTEELHPDKMEKMLAQKKFHNNSVILINSIHKDVQKNQSWEKLIALPTITVSIDMFYLGALFIRKEQVKEHFTVRI
ncbi:hypothetical protein [Flagellimonas maritima]|nr:hypothetical protein [Allomuricauda aurantiaca]